MWVLYGNINERARRKDLVLGAHRYVQAQLGKTRELKSYDVLEALFA